ncbi:hypothetical protein [Pseudoduganella sp. GCM10020061]|uniref:hypothetical protein n=1 Tax=Pseudoduganella sp. GCM10020061 TaxID=3317345 RepID=UPI00363403C2
MRRAFVLLLPVLLAGCVRDSATYYISGNEHTVTVRAEQPYFWDDSVDLSLLAARLPECQRLFRLAKAAPGLALTLHSDGDNAFTLKSDAGTWSFETERCTMLEPKPATGELIGTFRLEGKQMVFAPAAPSAAP